MANTSKQAQWAEAKKRCKLSGEALAMAKEMGLNPRSLIKNIPSPSQPWKQPVEAWIREMHSKRGGKKRGKAPDPTGLPEGQPPVPPEVSTHGRAEATPPVRTPGPADPGYPIDANIAPLVAVLNCLPGLGTFSSCGGHPPPLSISQAPEGHYWISFCIDPWDGGWESLQNLAYVVADMENVTIKIWLAGYGPDTIAFELAGVGDPLNLAAILEGWRTTGQLPEDLRWDDPEVTGRD